MMTELGIDGLEAVEQIGSGSSSTVYRAYQRHMDRWIAVKVISATDSPPSAQMLTELRAMGRLSQLAGTVAIYDTGVTEAAEPYLLMQYFPGGSLQDFLVEHGAMAPEFALPIMAEVSDTLHRAHQAGTLHRDIKPSNVLLGEEWHPFVSDFGMVSVLDACDEDPQPPSGERRFIAPEVAGGAEPSAAGDVFSVGVITALILDGDSVSDTVNIARSAPDLAASASLHESLRSTMSPDPSARPSSAGEFAAMLRSALPAQTTHPLLGLSTDMGEDPPDDVGLADHKEAATEHHSWVGPALPGVPAPPAPDAKPTKARRTVGDPASVASAETVEYHPEASLPRDDGVVLPSDRELFHRRLAGAGLLGALLLIGALSWGLARRGDDGTAIAGEVQRAGIDQESAASTEAPDPTRTSGSDREPDDAGNNDDSDADDTEAADDSGTGNGDAGRDGGGTPSTTRRDAQTPTVAKRPGPTTSEEGSSRNPVTISGDGGGDDPGDAGGSTTSTTERDVPSVTVGTTPPRPTSTTTTTELLRPTETSTTTTTSTSTPTTSAPTTSSTSTTSTSTSTTSTSTTSTSTTSTTTSTTSTTTTTEPPPPPELAGPTGVEVRSLGRSRGDNENVEVTWSYTGEVDGFYVARSQLGGVAVFPEDGTLLPAAERSVELINKLRVGEEIYLLTVVAVFDGGEARSGLVRFDTLPE